MYFVCNRYKSYILQLKSTSMPRRKTRNIPPLTLTWGRKRKLWPRQTRSGTGDISHSTLDIPLSFFLWFTHKEHPIVHPQERIMANTIVYQSQVMWCIFYFRVEWKVPLRRLRDICYIVIMHRVLSRADCFRLAESFKISRLWFHHP